MKKYKSGDRVKFKFSVGWFSILTCEGIDGLNGILDEKMLDNKAFYNLTLCDIKYKLISAEKEILTFEASGILEEC